MNDRDRQDPAINQPRADGAAQADADTDARLLGAGGPSLGERIRRAREAKNLDQADLVEPLNLDLRVIINVERDQLDQTPGRPFIIAYIKSWAEQLDLDPQVLIAQYQAQTAPPSTQINGGQHPTLDVMDEGKGRLRKWLTSLFIVLILAIVLALAVQFGADKWSQWFADEAEQLTTEQTHSGNQTTPEMIESAIAPLQSAALPEQYLSSLDVPPPPTQTALPADEGLAPPPAMEEGGTVDDHEQAQQDGVMSAQEPESVAKEASIESEPTAPTAETEERLQLRASGGDCWIEVRSAEGERLMYDVLRDGNSRSFSGKGPFNLVLGNPSVMEVLWDGEPVDLEGRHDLTGVLRIEVGG